MRRVRFFLQRTVLYKYHSANLKMSVDHSAVPEVITDETVSAFINKKPGKVRGDDGILMDVFKYDRTETQNRFVDDYLHIFILFFIILYLQ